MRRAAVQWVRNVPQRDGGRMTDGQLDGRTQRCEELEQMPKEISKWPRRNGLSARKRNKANVIDTFCKNPRNIAFLVVRPMVHRDALPRQQSVVEEGEFSDEALAKSKTRYQEVSAAV